MEGSVFIGPVCYRSGETSEEDEVEFILKTTPITIGAGAVEAAGVNAKRLGLFVEVLKDRQRFKVVVSA